MWWGAGPQSRQQSDGIVHGREGASPRRGRARFHAADSSLALSPSAPPPPPREVSKRSAVANEARSVVGPRTAQEMPHATWSGPRTTDTPTRDASEDSSRKGDPTSSSAGSMESPTMTVTRLLVAVTPVTPATRRRVLTGEPRDDVGHDIEVERCERRLHGQRARTLRANDAGAAIPRSAERAPLRRWSSVTMLGLLSRRRSQQPADSSRMRNALAPMAPAPAASTSWRRTRSEVTTVASAVAAMSSRIRSSAASRPRRVA